MVVSKNVVIKKFEGNCHAFEIPRNIEGFKSEDVQKMSFVHIR